MPRHSRSQATQRPDRSSLPKTPTGIRGFDELTGGGLPRGRPTLVCGGPGCGKTLFAMEFLVRGAMEHGEPGVFMSFEETGQELAKNVSSLGFDLHDLEERGLLRIDHVHVDRNEIEEAGEYDLEGLFVRLGHAIDAIEARRVVLDTLESLFSAFSNDAILRSELRRLFGWLKQRGVTAVITGERGDSARLTRQGLEEYVSDCVIVLDHSAQGQISTRRLRVVKYRGSSHGTNQYPFLIEDHGITIAPITSVGLSYAASSERISSGIEELDVMLGGGGFYRGSSVLLSGTSGSGKSSVGASFARSVGSQGGRCLFFSYEESASQILRNSRTIGIDLEPLVKSRNVIIHSARPQLHGLEMHLALMHRMVREERPTAVVVDPLGSLRGAGEEADVKLLVLRLVDFLKGSGVTTLFTDLIHGGQAAESTEVGLSSLMDTWILLRDIELGGERNRAVYVLKSRGMAHSNQIREFLITSQGIRLQPAYLGEAGVLTGSARVAQEARDRRDEVERRLQHERRQTEAARRRQALQAQIESLRLEIESIESEIGLDRKREVEREQSVTDVKAMISSSRRVEGNGSPRGTMLGRRSAAASRPGAVGKGNSR
jgi:circadian clock protein KaiC